MYKVVDLFAGAGGLSLGFEMTKKFDILAFVENNDSAAETYYANHTGQSLKRYENIKKIDFLKVLKDIGGIVDVVIGGPPCQGFSNANRQRRKIINGSNELVKCYVDAIKYLKPKVFVMENVKTIDSNKHLYYLNEKERKYIKEELKLKIYKTKCILYDEPLYIDGVVNLLHNPKKIKQLYISNENLNILRIFKQSKVKIQNYVKKDKNINQIRKLAIKLDKKVDCDSWYSDILSDVSRCLMEISHDNLKNKDIDNLKVFFYIQDAFRNIIELSDENILYKIEIEQEQIIATIETYRIIEYIKKSFEYLGYKTNGKVLNAVNYGVPQKRQRYIMIGIKEKLLNDKEIEMPKPIIVKEENYINVSDAISDLEQYNASKKEREYAFYRKDSIEKNNLFSKIVFDSNKICNHVCTNTGENAIKRFEFIEQGANFHSLPDELKNNTYENPSRTQNTIYKRLLYNKPSDTVVNVRKSMWIHPTQNRAISQREAARLQSFPDSYIFYGNKDSIYQQIGNAVPPFLGRVIAETVLNLLGDNDFDSLESIYNSLL